MAKSQLTKKEEERLFELRTARMMLCDAGRWTRDSYDMPAAQRENEEETRRLVAKRDGKVWL